MHDLDVGDGALADNTKIKHSDVTGKEALLDILGTINTQFDELLNASYHQDGQKLLVTNRYLQQRFDNPNVDIDTQLFDYADEVETIKKLADDTVSKDMR